MLDTQMPVNSVREELDSIDNEIVKELDKLFAKQQAEIDELNKLVSEIREACDYTNAAENIKSLIIRHKEKE